MPFNNHPLVFPWDTLNAIVGGLSAVDVPRLQVYSLHEAESFLEGYGFRWDDQLHCIEIERVRQEAWHFLREELLTEEENKRIPKEVAEQKDLRRLLMWASERGEHPSRQRWSCVLLRLMHTFAHSESHFNNRFGEEIRKQITDRFMPHLKETEDGFILGDNNESIALAEFDIKQSKPKHSLVMKLLHKPENVATDVFDRIGVRFVTLDKLDALRVVQYLRTRNVFMFANVKPSRSKNSLIDVGWLRQEVEDMLGDGTLTPDEQVALLRKRMEEIPYTGPPDTSRNPHSSRKYHSIQFTCRQMIRVNNPYAAELVSRVEAARMTEPGMTRVHDSLLRSLKMPTQIRFFFPFEVQIMDKKSFAMSRSGDAAHADYKKRQWLSVRRRVLGAALAGSF